MKITLESTSQIVQFNGVNCRVWEGQTESGIPLHAFIREQAEPSVIWPLGMVL